MAFTFIVPPDEYKANCTAEKTVNTASRNSEGGLIVFE